MTLLTCHIKSIQPISDTVSRVRLTPEQPVHFKAGQYLSVVMGEKDKRPFSIASSPTEQGEIELHIGASENNAYAMAVMDKLLKHTQVMVDIPLGEAWLRDDSQRPLLLIAGGTGYSYVRSILINALVLNPEREIHLYWGGKEAKHLYDLNFLEALCVTHPNLNIVLVIEETQQQAWSGKVGMVLDAVLDDFTSLENYDIYIAGRFEMAKVARERFSQQRQANKAHMYSDAYSFF